MSAFYDLSKTPRNILNQAIVRAIVSENNGALFDPADLSTLYQDAAGTVPVTAVGQPVGKILDKSGNGNHATQPITASRPTLIYENGMYGLRFDGIDDYLNLPYMGLYANGSASIVSALSYFTNTSNMTVLSEGYNTSTNQIYLPMTKVVGSGYGVYVRNDSRTELLSYLPADSFTVPVMVKVHIDSGSDFHFYRNGGLLSDANYSRAGTLTLNNTTIGAARQVSLFNFFGGNLYGLIITKSALSDTDRRKCEVYLGRKAGVQL